MLNHSVDLFLKGCLKSIQMLLKILWKIIYIFSALKDALSF